MITVLEIAPSTTGETESVSTLVVGTDFSIVFTVLEPLTTGETVGDTFASDPEFLLVLSELDEDCTVEVLEDGVVEVGETQKF